MSFERINLSDFYTVEREKKKPPFSWFSKSQYKRSYSVKGKHRKLKLDEETRVHFDKPTGTIVRVRRKGRTITTIGGTGDAPRYGVILPAGTYNLEMTSAT